MFRRSVVARAGQFSGQREQAKGTDPNQVLRHRLGLAADLHPPERHSAEASVAQSNIKSWARRWRDGRRRDVRRP